MSTTYEQKHSTIWTERDVQKRFTPEASEREEPHWLARDEKQQELKMNSKAKLSNGHIGIGAVSIALLFTFLLSS